MHACLYIGVNICYYGINKGRSTDEELKISKVSDLKMRYYIIPAVGVIISEDTIYNIEHNIYRFINFLLFAYKTFYKLLL